MVIDTSAIIAILENEALARRLSIAIKGASVRRISAASLLEASIVIYARMRDHGDRELDLLIHRMQVDIIPVTIEQVELARSAFRKYGKSQHPACLNFGDCFSYALSVSLAEPLLFTGNDFGRTDVDIATY